MTQNNNGNGYNQRDQQQSQAPRKRVSYNHVQLLGNVGGDPTIINKGGSKTAQFSLAVDASYTDKNGQYVERTSWFNCVAFGRTAEIIENSVSRGTRIFVTDARLSQNTYVENKTQETRSAVQVIVEYFLFFGNKRKDGESNDDQNYTRGNNDLPDEYYEEQFSQQSPDNRQ